MEAAVGSGGGRVALAGGGWRSCETACDPADGARDTGAGPVLPLRGPDALTSPGPGPGFVMNQHISLVSPEAPTNNIRFTFSDYLLMVKMEYYTHVATAI
ncbi:unnamed protein product [Colias eurytheme]|nr:unnamed protein product [Colias eurytheme]